MNEEQEKQLVDDLLKIVHMGLATQPRQKWQWQE